VLVLEDPAHPKLIIAYLSYLRNGLVILGVGGADKGGTRRGGSSPVARMGPPAGRL
jgi:hypothetical protein